jgi:hypothetical protein
MSQNSVEICIDIVTVPLTCAAGLRRLRFVGLMFSLQAGTTFLRPSVPSQKRDCTTIIIRPTHISQDQWSTAGAATSSGLSRGHIARDQWSTAGAATSSGLSTGRASRKRCQTSKEQRAELLDALMFETTEVKPESEESN